MKYNFRISINVIIRNKYKKNIKDVSYIKRNDKLCYNNFLHINGKFGILYF